MSHVGWMLGFTGVVRPARYLEVALIGGACRHVHFGWLIAIPFALTLAVAMLVRSLLRDLGVRSPWPEIGSAMWLLQPLGAEAALWPSALHVPLGLVLTLVALRSWRRGHIVAGGVTGGLACLCIEQVIFALPAAAWIVTPPERRVRALTVAAMTSVLVLASYHQWPGSTPRAPLTLAEMIRNVFRTPFYYARLPATSLGLHSIPLATLWALPWSVLLLGAGMAAGYTAGPRLLAPPARGGRVWSVRHVVVAAAVLTVLLNIPGAVTFPRATSGRVFTPTWLLLAVAAAVLGSQVRWRRPRLAGSASGVLAMGCVLSLAFSAWVRVRTADIVQLSFRWIGARVPQNGVVAICDVRRTMVPYAPVGDFHTSEFLHAWLAEAALAYHTGVTATVRQGGQYWEDRCPDVRGADLVVTPVEILDRARRESESSAPSPANAPARAVPSARGGRGR